MKFNKLFYYEESQKMSKKRKFRKYRKRNNIKIYKHQEKYCKVKKIILIFILILMYILISFKLSNLSNLPNIKVCLCTVGKLENKYIREFVEYYKKYHIDKIFLYDNNEFNGEKFEDVIGDYISKNYVEIINKRGKRGNLINIMDNCYQNNHNNYDWLIFYEIDEFIYLKNFNSIKTFLNQTKFEKCDSIQLNWVHRSDGNNLYYQNKPLQERFPEKGKNVVKNKYNPICNIKTIVKGHLSNIIITDNHFLSKNLKACNALGNILEKIQVLSLDPDYENYYINHYYGKSTEEFAGKILRGDILRGTYKGINNYQVYKYFVINEITAEKLKYLEKTLGSRIDLENYWKLLDKNKTLRN